LSVFSSTITGAFSSAFAAGPAPWSESAALAAASSIAEFVGVKHPITPSAGTEHFAHLRKFFTPRLHRIDNFIEINFSHISRCIKVTFSLPSRSAFHRFPKKCPPFSGFKFPDLAGLDIFI
jgi:hypothetical protein